MLTCRKTPAKKNMITIFVATRSEQVKDNENFLFLLQKIFYLVFYPSYVSICKDLQKTIVLSSGPFLQAFTFTI